jgi:phytoene dehydrogenase-like protein
MLNTAAGSGAIAIPSQVDASLAPAGHSAIVLVALAPPDLHGEWDRKAPGYRERKRQAGDALIAVAEQVLPDLRQHIVYRQEATPATVARYAWTSGGSIYGPALGWKPHAKTPVPGLMLAGSGVFPGAGVEAVVISGMIAADLLCPAEARPVVRTEAVRRVHRHEDEAEELAAVPLAG